jgi:plasmid replication protein
MSKNTKEVQRRADAKRAGRTRNFATVVYPESAPQDWLEKLAEAKIEALVSPLHDKDKNPDGEPKKAHYHVILMFETVKTTEQVKEITEKIGGVGVEKINSLRGYARYLIHADNPEKAQYNKADIKQFGGADYESICSLASDKYAAIREMIQYCTTNEIISYADLLRYAAEQNENWFRCLCDNGTVVMKEFLKSLAWEQMQAKK